MQNGRGYIQLTVWNDLQNNGGVYNEVSQKLGMGCELVANPEKALLPEVAYKIASQGMKDGWFRKNETLSKYIHENTCDYKNARNIINSLLKDASEVAGYASTFEAMLRATMFS